MRPSSSDVRGLGRAPVVPALLVALAAPLTLVVAPPAGAADRLFWDIKVLAKKKMHRKHRKAKNGTRGGSG